MKKVFLLFLATAGSLSVLAQNINPETDYVGNGVPSQKKIVKPDSMLSPWVIDANLTGGILSGHASNKAALGAHYTNAVNSNISNMKYNDGTSFGIDAQVGYFFDHKRQFGVGAGLLYFYQQNKATIDRYHVEYQSTDNFGNTFRQEITANGKITETISANNFNIPIVFKYKTRISGNIGFTADAGILINVMEQDNYSTNAGFDYEAVYQYVGTEGGITTVYDNAPTPAQGDLVITKSRYQATHPSASINDYFNSLRDQGYNVGLGVKPYKHTGSVNLYGSVGLLLRPAISVYLSDNIALNFGAFYVYQGFNHSGQGNYRMTDQLGQYSSVLNNVKSVSNNAYGLSAGVRIFLPHKEHEQIVIPEIPAEEAAENAEPEEREIPEATEPAHIDLSTPILFDINKTVIKPNGYNVLEEAIREMKDNPNLNLVIHGYTDITGGAAYNRGLSKRRAQAVKNFLVHKGANGKHLKTVGHGAKSPAATNSTRAGRAQNRRVIMKVKQDGE